MDSGVPVKNDVAQVIKCTNKMRTQSNDRIPSQWLEANCNMGSDRERIIKASLNWRDRLEAVVVLIFVI